MRTEVVVYLAIVEAIGCVEDGATQDAGFSSRIPNADGVNDPDVDRTVPRDLSVDVAPDAPLLDAPQLPDAPPPPPTGTVCVLPLDDSWTTPYSGACSDLTVWFDGMQEIGGQLTRHVSLWNSGPEGSMLEVSAIDVSDMRGGAPRFSITLRIFDTLSGAWGATSLPLDLLASRSFTGLPPPLILVIDISYDATYSGSVPDESLLITTNAAWISIPLEGRVECRSLAVENENVLDCFGPLCDCCFVSEFEAPPCASAL